MILRIVEFHGAHLLRMILFVFSLYLQSIVYLHFMFLNLGSKYVLQVCCVTCFGALICSHVDACRYQDILYSLERNSPF